ncbi:MAG: hypothetical protein KAG37_10085 [Flavobacteriales bacterium]|nr:hypothetical protein [Flavobacteriales bacterium]
MKKIYAILIVVFTLNITVTAQEDSTLVKKTEKKSEIKKGWNFGVLPTITYNSDLGFQYGALVDLYNYGDGDLYPNYYERYYMEVSRFTKGNGVNNFQFESNRLIKGSTVFFDLMYRTDKRYDFLGVNGYESMYNVDWIDPDSDDYHSEMFYKNQTNYFKVKADILTPFNDKWSWSVGFEYFKFDVDYVDMEDFNDGRETPAPEHTEMPGLYERFVKWGVVDEEYVYGGSFGGLKGGLMFDTRNNMSNATKGIWTELVFFYVPGFMSSTNNTYLNFNFTHRQYFTIVPDRLSFAYRLGYVGTIFGDEPVYAQANMYSVMLKGSPGFGLGGKNTLRGVKRNRVIGNGEAWLNAEFRWKFVKFDLWKQHFYLGLTAFFDAGQVVELTGLESKITKINNDTPLTDETIWGAHAIGVGADGSPNGDTIEDYFNFGGEALHMSAGIGFQIVMNQNFIVKVDYGKTFNIQDGPSGMYIGLNYLF